MANISGIIGLANGMRAYLAGIGCSAVVAPVGWTQREQHLNQGAGQANRILLYPGKEPGGKAGAGGSLTRNARPSTTNPRALVTWMRDITMSVWAVDTTDTHNEEKQISAVENLFELAIQAAHRSVDPDTNMNAGLAAIEWGNVRYTNPPANMRFGQELLIEFVLKCPIFDQTLVYVTPQTSLGRGSIVPIVTIPGLPGNPGGNPVPSIANGAK